MEPHGASMPTSIGLCCNFNTRWNQHLGHERKSLNSQKSNSHKAYDMAQEAVVPSRQTYCEIYPNISKLSLWCSECSVPFNPDSHCLIHKVHDSIPQRSRCRDGVPSRQSSHPSHPRCCRKSSLTRSPWRLPHQR